MTSRTAVLRSLRLALPLGLALAAGCTDAAPPAAQRAQAIAGGASDTVDTSIVSVVLPGGGVCSGSLIAPNLVLTARHCVSFVPEEAVWCQAFRDTDGATRAVTLTMAPYAAGQFLVTTSPALRRPRDAGADASALVVHFVSRVIVPADSTGVPLCGRDIGLLELADVVPPSEAEPLVPRLDLPPIVGEIYTAIGYGGTDDNGTGLGTRRILGDLAVTGVGQMTVGSISPVIVQETEEWSGDHGVCGGDSGGPALSTHREVIGSVSRGSAGCNTPVYTRVDSFADLIRQTAFEAAVDGNYAPPFWVNPPAARSVPRGDGCLQDIDCAEMGDECIYPSLDARRRLCLSPDCAHCPAGFVCGPTGETQTCVPTGPPPDAGIHTAADAALDAGGTNDGAVFVRPALDARGGCDAGGTPARRGSHALTAVSACALAVGARRRRRNSGHPQG